MREAGNAVAAVSIVSGYLCDIRSSRMNAQLTAVRHLKQ